MNLALNDFDIVVFDLDGTIYTGTQLIKDADKVVKFFREKGKRIFFGTNNSSKSREDIANKLRGMGVECKDDEVINSAYLTAYYIYRNNIDNVFVYGSPKLIADIKSFGTNVCDEKTAENVVVGFNINLDYEYLSSAYRVALKAKNVVFCNEDKYYPSNDGILYPGCGLVSSAIRWCADCNDKAIVVGKPNTFLLEYIKENTGVPFERILCLGDSYESDYEVASRCGSKCILIGQDEEVKKIGDVAIYFSGVENNESR